jgi:AraC-like DNA-binding protein
MAPETLEQAVDLRRQGWSYRRIAEALGYASHSAVRLAVVRAIGITTTMSARERRTREAVQLREQGVPAALVAERLGYRDQSAVFKAVYLWRKRQRSQHSASRHFVGQVAESGRHGGPQSTHVHQQPAGAIPLCRRHRWELRAGRHGPRCATCGLAAGRGF